MNKKLTKKQLDVIRIFNAVSLQDQDILIRRFIEGHTQKETARIWHLTNERVRQIEEEALQKIEDNLN